jgi:hypothetical protein
MARQILDGLLVIFFAAFLFSLAGDGLFIYLSSDDMMNLYWAWETPLPSLLAANLFPFTTVYRPFGAVVYRTVFAFAGLDPFPFRCLTYILLLVNLYLTFRLAKALTGSREIGILAALAVVFHGRFVHMYADNGFLYDVLCFPLYLLTILFYHRVRSRDMPVRGWNLLCLYLLFTAALNAKELALTLPGVLLAYEIIYHRPSEHSVGGLKRWLRESALVPLIMLCISIGAYWGKVAPGSPLRGNPAYIPNYSLDQLTHSVVGYLSELFYLDVHALNPSLAAGYLFVLCALPIVARSRHLAFCVALMALSPVPVLFCYRAFTSMYISLAGLGIYSAIVIVSSRDWLLDRLSLPQRWSPVVGGAARVTCFAAIAVLLFTVHLADIRARPIAQSATRHQYLRGMKEDLLQVHQHWPARSKVLFIDTPYGSHYTATFLMRLLYQDPTIDVGILGANVPDLAFAKEYGYDYVFDYQDGELVLVGNSVLEERLNRLALTAGARQ